MIANIYEARLVRFSVLGRVELQVDDIRSPDELGWLRHELFPNGLDEPSVPVKCRLVFEREGADGG